MNALLELIVLAGSSFLLFMYMGYKDATRKAAPKGILASLFNNLSFWKAEDENGIRGYLYRQNIILKVVVAFIGTVLGLAACSRLLPDTPDSSFICWLF